MPAVRSRTEHWRECLRKVHDRGGALEISINRGTTGPLSQTPVSAEIPLGTDVVWRCRIISISDEGICVEPPAAFGVPLHLQNNVALIGAMTIGQNRWMFHTRSLGYTNATGVGANSRGLIVAFPENVERCARRSFFRISTADLKLPPVQCWPLLDPATASAAESANRAQIREAVATRSPLPMDVESPDSLLLPDVGPMFPAKLLNLSGGGLGLLLEPQDAAGLNSRPYVWLRLDLRPEIPAPIGVTARLAHTHIDSGQNLYAGMAFDFANNPEHRLFIADLISDYIQTVQRVYSVPEAA